MTDTDTNTIIAATLERTDPAIEAAIQQRVDEKLELQATIRGNAMVAEALERVAIKGFGDSFSVQNFVDSGKFCNFAQEMMRDEVMQHVEGFDASDIAEQFSLSDIAAYVSGSDIAEEIDMQDLADRIDLDDIAKRVPTADIHAERIDYEKLSKFLDMDTIYNVLAPSFKRHREMTRESIRKIVQTVQDTIYQTTQSAREAERVWDNIRHWTDRVDETKRIAQNAPTREEMSSALAILRREIVRLEESLKASIENRLSVRLAWKLKGVAMWIGARANRLLHWTYRPSSKAPSVAQDDGWGDLATEDTSEAPKP